MEKIEHLERIHQGAVWIVDDGEIVPADIKFSEGRGKTQDGAERLEGGEVAASQTKRFQVLE